jgi:hypothetical protein
MSEHGAFERFVADRFADVERALPPAHPIDDLLSEARRTRPLPRWLATIKEPPMRVSSRVAVGSPILRVASLALLVMILSVLTAGGMAVGATLLASPSPEGPRTIVVAPDGTGDFTTITDAVTAALDGDTVLVKPGTYPGSVLITTDITVRGDGPAGSVVIEWTGDDQLIGPYGISLEDSSAHLADLVVRGPYDGRAIWVSGGAPLLEGLTVEHTGDWGDVPAMSFDFLNGTTATLRDSSGGAFLSITEGASPTIERVVLDAGGFISGTGTDPVIRDSRFGFALDISGGAEPTVEGNDLLGVALMAGRPVIRDNTFANPGFVAGATHNASEEITAVEVRGGGPLIVGNRIGDHEVGISVDPGSTPIIQDNLIEANTTGIVVSDGYTTPVLSGNTFCGNGTHLSVPAGSRLTLVGNTVCDAAASAAP